MYCSCRNFISAIARNSTGRRNRKKVSSAVSPEKVEAQPVIVEKEIQKPPVEEKAAETVQPVETQPEPVVQQQQQTPAPQTNENTTKKAEPTRKQLTVSASFYVANCAEGCTGITATGLDVRSSIYVNGLRIIAVDPNIIPLGTVVYVELANGDNFKALAGDTGGAIKGHKIDVLVSSGGEARRLGRQSATITILD